MRQHGFGEAELGRAKAGMLARYERAYNERDKSESAALADELVRHFLIAEAAPGIEVEVDLVQAVPADDHRRRDRGARRANSSPTTTASSSPTAPGKAGAHAGDGNGVARRAAHRADRVGRRPGSDEIAGRELLAKAPTPGTVKSRREIPEIGVTVLTLSNGVEVWLKPTTFRNDQISFTSYARGGLSLRRRRRLFQRVAGHVARRTLRRRRLQRRSTSASCSPASWPTCRRPSRHLHARDERQRRRRATSRRRCSCCTCSSRHPIATRRRST